MKTKVVKEVAAFTLSASSYNGEGEIVEVFFPELRVAPVGTSWEARDTHNCWRDLDEERAEVVYKTTSGAAVLFSRWGTTDSPNPEEWSGEPTLMWFQW